MPAKGGSNASAASYTACGKRLSVSAHAALTAGIVRPDPISYEALRMDVLWGLIVLAMMYIIVPVAILVATLAALGGGERFLPPALRSRTSGSPPDAAGENRPASTR
jgi:hypothetical protein